MSLSDEMFFFFFNTTNSRREKLTHEPTVKGVPKETIYFSHSLLMCTRDSRAVGRLTICCVAAVRQRHCLQRGGEAGLGQGWGKAGQGRK